MADVTILVEPIESDVTVIVSEVTSDKLIPTGGTTNQVLTKASATDYDTSWQSIKTIGGESLLGGGDVVLPSGGNLISTNYSYLINISNNSTQFAVRNYIGSVLTSSMITAVGTDFLSTNFPPPMIAYAKGNVEFDRFVLFFSTYQAALVGYTMKIVIMKGKINKLSQFVTDIATIAIKDFVLLANTEALYYVIEEADMIDNTMENGDCLFWAMQLTQTTGATQDMRGVQLNFYEK